MPNKTDTKTEKPSTGATTISISTDELAGLGTQIAELDTRIASASGSDTAAKKAFVEQLISQNAEAVDSIVNRAVEQIGAVDLPVLVGLLTRLEERIKADLVPKVDAYVTEEFPKTQGGSKEEVAALREQRKELLTQFRALREVLSSFKINTDSIPDPKRSGGGRPSGSGGGSKKSGMNKEGYRYFIDGKGRPPSQNTFSSLAFYATEGVPKATNDGTGLERWGASKLKEFLAENGVNFPADDAWEVKLPNNKVVSARRLTEQDKIEFGVTDDAAPAAPSTETPPVPEGAQS